MQTVAGRDIVEMLHRDETKSRRGVGGGGGGQASAVSATFSSLIRGNQPSRGSCTGGRYSPRISWLPSDFTERGRRKTQLCAMLKLTSAKRDVIRRQLFGRVATTFVSYVFMLL
jgi:hypothetical protein